MSDTLISPAGTDLETDKGEIRTGQATPIERVDLLEYKLAVSNLSRAEILIGTYNRELQHAQIELERTRQELSVVLKSIEYKYHVNMRISTITEDGVVVPREVPVRNSRQG
jgi:hypothetical protein